MHVITTSQLQKPNDHNSDRLDVKRKDGAFSRTARLINTASDNGLRLKERKKVQTWKHMYRRQGFARMFTDIKKHLVKVVYLFVCLFIKIRRV